MKIAIIAARMALGLVLVAFSLPIIFNLIEQPEPTGNMKVFNDGLNAARFIMPLVKWLELICGLAFLVGRFVPLAIVVIFPIVVTIVGVHLFLLPEGTLIAVAMLGITLFLAYAYRDRYKELLSAQ